MAGRTPEVPLGNVPRVIEGRSPNRLGTTDLTIEVIGD
jgi:hypothetical protein